MKEWEFVHCRSELFRERHVYFLTVGRSLPSPRWQTDSEHLWVDGSWESTMQRWAVNTDQIAPGVLWYWELKTGPAAAVGMVPWIVLCLLVRVWKVPGSWEKHMEYVGQRNRNSSCISLRVAPVYAPILGSLGWGWLLRAVAGSDIYHRCHAESGHRTQGSVK